MYKKIFNLLPSIDSAMNLKYLLLVFLFISCSSDEPIKVVPPKESGEFLNDWTYEVFVDPEFSQSKAVFKLWIPEGITPKYIIVLAPGGFGNGIDLVTRKLWQDYARENKVALLGVYVTSTSPTYTNALLTALNKITKERGVSYVNDLKFLLRGYSSGGRFSYVFASSYPNKTIAVANIKGLLWYEEKMSKNIAELIIVGKKESEARIESLKTVFETSRENNKICCFAIEPNWGHGIGDSDQLVRDFFSAVLDKKRISKEPLTEKNSYLGNMQTLEYSPFSDYLYNKEIASCLIDENFSIKWVDFMKGD